ncbi:MAG: hypothetical protein A4E48_00590 [Methanosaeta sp. PtaU1.Bin060]|jgi:hypothetical protein|nr:MAG: hypothetical protein A4E48_00590 [Methanosaeta sp. PtaU1.Bin060]
MKRFICKNCGSVNLVNPEDLAEDDEWLECELPENFEWILPAGKITPVIGSPIYVSAVGEHLTRDAYILEYNLDPEVAYRLMRERVGGVRMASRFMAKKQKTTANASSAPKSHSLLDEDDWTD